MRFVQAEGDGDFSLVECGPGSVPDYAILSHTWGPEHEEVTFRDLVERTGKSKAGYRKLDFCAKQAARDGLQYFWIDTCCIDRSSSAELRYTISVPLYYNTFYLYQASETINSMFRWYSNATKCYVYLSDLSIGASAESQEAWTIVDGSSDSRESWDIALQQCRWFTRCWTLQELLAPNSVEFFSAEGQRLGDKASMVEELHSITKIDIEALRGSPLSRFSVDERMLWALGRQAKREEDAAYSLLGIFGVNMPLIYGEGRWRAYRRLKKEIRDSQEESEPGSDTLEDGQLLNPGQSVTSQDARYRFVMQTDGNLVLYGPNPGALWASNTMGKDVEHLMLQQDGNLVMYDKKRRAVWDSHTKSRTGAKLVMQNDGDVVLYAGGQLVSITHTSGGRTQSSLSQGHRLTLGQHLDASNNRYRFILQSDGNLVLYGPSGTLWASVTGPGSNNVQYVILQYDGNLVMYSNNERVVWASDTKSRDPATLVVQDDGNVVIYAGREAIWATHTVQTSVAPPS